MNATRIKICGITRLEDALLTVQLGVDALGFVFYAKSPRCLTITQANKIISALPPFVTRVGLFVDPDADHVKQVLQQVSLDVLQFHGEETPNFCGSFSKPYIKAIRMRPKIDLREQAEKYMSAAAFLLDSYNENVLGGTGTTFDWSLIPKNFVKPIILAGGLTAENVVSAIQQVKPYAVDVSSGVESDPGIKDAKKLTEFINALS